MSLKNLLQRQLISCSPETTVSSIAQSMADHNVGAVVVVQDKKPIGIITDRDIVLRCVVQGLNCSQQTARAIMSKSLVTVPIQAGLFDIVKAMKTNEIRRIPVVGDDGQAVGLLSFGDIFQLLAKELSDLSAPAAPEIPKIVEQVA